MTRRSVALLCVLAALALSLRAPQVGAQSTPAGSARVTIPDTPAGRTLSAWLDAFNSGDSSRMAAFSKRYDPDNSAPGVGPFRNQTGGFELLQILTSDPRRISVLVKEKKSETRARAVLSLGAGDPPVATFGILALPEGATLADFTIDAAARARVIDSAAANLDTFYVFPDVAKKMEEAARTKLGRGGYDTVDNGADFADMLTADFRAVSHDMHLRVNFIPRRLPAMRQGPNPDAEAQMRKQMEEQNCAFERVERLTGNVGYLKFNGFMPPEICGPTASASMAFLANVKALIIDLRENGGGDPKMVAFLCSYFFSQPTHLNDLWTRRTGETQQFWTLPYVPGKRLADIPVYLLTSKHTFSGAEEFSYDLQNQKRVTIIGETTGGGAHPVSGHRIDDHFMIGVPFARAINPITKTNWEGVGVQPDVKVPAAEALATAERMAADKLAAK